MNYQLPIMFIIPTQGAPPGAPFYILQNQRKGADKA